jgi:hypothetical protein
MKFLAWYTIVIYGLALLGCFTSPTSGFQWLGMIMLAPMLIFAILYLVKTKNEKKEQAQPFIPGENKFCSWCGTKNHITSAYCSFCGKGL